jgi:hypothetical protein
LVDGWCPIIWLYAEIPGPAQPDKAAVVHQVGAKQLAILASVLSGSTPGVTCGKNRRKRRSSYPLLQLIAGNQPARCGLAEVRGRWPRSR